MLDRLHRFAVVTEDKSAEKITPRRQYSTPDYLERRKIDKEKRKSVKSRLLPLFRRSESLQSDKVKLLLEFCCTYDVKNLMPLGLKLLSLIY